MAGGEEETTLAVNLGFAQKAETDCSVITYGFGLEGQR